MIFNLWSIDNYLYDFVNLFDPNKLRIERLIHYRFYFNLFISATALVLLNTLNSSTMRASLAGRSLDRIFMEGDDGHVNDGLKGGDLLRGISTPPPRLSRNRRRHQLSQVHCSIPPFHCSSSRRRLPSPPLDENRNNDNNPFSSSKANSSTLTQVRDHRNGRRNRKALFLVFIVGLYLAFGSFVFSGFELEEELKRINQTNSIRAKDEQVLKKFWVR